MLMIVLLALRGARVANSGAELRASRSTCSFAGTPLREAARRLAYVRAVKAGADALAHARLLGRAGVGAAQAHPGAGIKWWAALQAAG